VILTVSTNRQSKSRKCTSWAYLLVLAIAKLWLSTPLDEDEIKGGVVIKLWHGRVK